MNIDWEFVTLMLTSITCMVGLRVSLFFPITGNIAIVERRLDAKIEAMANRLTVDAREREDRLATGIKAVDARADTLVSEAGEMKARSVS